MKPVELVNLRLKDVDLETGRVYPGTAKRGSGRVLQLKPSTLAMLKRYIHKHNINQKTQIWASTRRLSENWMRLRKSVAEKLSEPHLTQIRLYDLRHFYATMLYVKTKDIVHVKRQLGHRNIANTLRYVGILSLDMEEFVVKVAIDIEGSKQLLEQGFSFVAIIEGAYVFKKVKLPSLFSIHVYLFTTKQLPYS